jgi:hypothetical protein
MTNPRAITLSLALIAAASPAQAGATGVQISYTKIHECQEQIENPNAAFSQLQCKNIGKAAVSISIQAPQFFNLSVTQNGVTATSEWDLLTGEQPMEPGKTLEWHVQQGEPRFLVFRLRYNNADAAAKQSATPQQQTPQQQEVLTVNWVHQNRICILAAINTAKNPHANQIARDLINTTFNRITTCPADWLRI